MYVDEIYLVLLPYQGLFGVFVYWFDAITIIILTSHIVQKKFLQVSTQISGLKLGGHVGYVTDARNEQSFG
jgi:hypothetical protein